MEIPIPHRARAPPALPEIYIQDSNPSDRIRMYSKATPYHSISSPANIPGPMSIPNAREPVPPPLPPPRHLADFIDGGHSGPDIAWQWGNSHEDNSWGRSVAPGSSLYGSFASERSSKDLLRDSSRHANSISTIKTVLGPDSRENQYPRIDEGYASLSGTSVGSNRSKFEEPLSFRSRFQSSVHDTYRSNAQAFDKSQLQKLDARRGSDNTTPPRGFKKSTFSSSVNDASATSRVATIEQRYPAQLKPLSLPILPGKPGFVESPVSKWADPINSAGVSPGNPFARYSPAQLEFRSSSDTADSERSPLPFTRRSGSGSVVSICDDASSVASRSRDNCDARISPDHDVDFPMEEHGFRRLQIEDPSSRQDGHLSGVSAGQKRRASSPLVEEGPSSYSVGSGSELFRRRESGSRSYAPPGSMSSNSYPSTTLSIAVSNISSTNSYGRMSPGVLSPAPTDGSESPYFTSLSLNPSPRGSISRSNHNRTISDTRPSMTSRKMSDVIVHSKSNSAPKIHSVHICECCPKKPKKFDSEAELNAHEQEKQYECAYCRNRFKNKNEAERHQNSLHLRRHSWSCAALSGYEAAFHTSPTQPNDTDSCGYCGEEFIRSGLSSPTSSGLQVAFITDQDWDIRIAHLMEMHKFGECNHAKKFFRADHFRQHLKHSHAGTSGKWTNMLENACMKDEPLPEPIRGPGRVSPGEGRVARISEEDEMS